MDANIFLSCDIRRRAENLHIDTKFKVSEEEIVSGKICVVMRDKGLDFSKYSHLSNSFIKSIW